MSPVASSSGAPHAETDRVPTKALGASSCASAGGGEA